jgi:hypothetical protein
VVHSCGAFYGRIRHLRIPVLLYGRVSHRSQQAKHQNCGGVVQTIAAAVDRCTGVPQVAHLLIAAPITEDSALDTQQW